MVKTTGGAGRSGRRFGRSAARGTRSVPPRCADGGAPAAAHTEPPATAIAGGAAPGLDALVDPRGPPVDARDGALPRRRATHTVPSPTATAVGSRADPDRPRHRVRARVDAQQRPVDTVDDPTAPSPTAIALGPLPTGIARTTCRSGVDPRHRARLLARHPQRAGAGRDRGRVRADRHGRVRPPRSRSIRGSPRRRPTRPTPRPPAASARGTLPTATDARPCSRPGRPGPPCAIAVRDPQRAAAVRERSGAATDGDPHRAVALRSMRETVPSAALAIHTDPPPSVAAPGSCRRGSAS